MRLGVMLPLRGRVTHLLEDVADYEAAGADIVWVPEAYGRDAVSLVGAIAARTSRIEVATGVLSIYSRTPATLAMTAAGLDAVSGGRAVLGIGASGPQVVEGWHGVPYEAPVARTREVVDICRQIWAREGPVTHPGPRHPLPLPGSRGRPLKLLEEIPRPGVPIAIAALGPRNVALAAELAQTWLPAFWWPERVDQVWGGAVAAGVRLRDPTLPSLDIAVSAAVSIGEDLDVARRVQRSDIAHYVGGMGSRTDNYYAALMRRYGLAAAADAVQDAYLAGDRRTAAAAVPDELLRATGLVGTVAEVGVRLEAFASSGVTTVNAVLVAHGRQRRRDDVAALRRLLDAV